MSIFFIAQGASLNTDKEASTGSQNQPNVVASQYIVKQNSQAQPLPTAPQGHQQNTASQQHVTSYGNQQSTYQEGAWYQSLQQSVGKPKQAYPESTMPQPLPSMPVENGLNSVVDKVENETLNPENQGKFYSHLEALMSGFSYNTEIH